MMAVLYELVGHAIWDLIKTVATLDWRWISGAILIVTVLLFIFFKQRKNATRKGRHCNRLSFIGGPEKLDEYEEGVYGVRAHHTGNGQNYRFYSLSATVLFSNPDYGMFKTRPQLILPNGVSFSRSDSIPILKPAESILVPLLKCSGSTFAPVGGIPDSLENGKWDIEIEINCASRKDCCRQKLAVNIEEGFCTWSHTDQVGWRRMVWKTKRDRSI